MINTLPSISKRWQQQLGAPVELGIGMNSGLARVGNTGTRQKFKYGPLGDTVNIASRLESHGVPGRVHVSETVHQALGKRYNCEKRGMIELKNRGELQTWVVNGLAVLAPDGRSGSPD